MKLNRFVLTASAVCMSFAIQANAAAYKCVGNTGKVEYRDVPCASSQKVEKTFDQELGSNPPAAARAGEGSKLASNAAPADEKARQSGAAQAETNTRQLAGSPTTADARSDYALGGLCSGNISWDNCRKLGIDSIVDCKRMDEDTVFRVSVLESKGVQCRTRPEHPVRTK